MRAIDIALEIRAHAERPAQYNVGWDVFVEDWTIDEIVAELKTHKITTLPEALAHFGAKVEAT